MRRYRQICWCRYTLVDAASKIELGAVAGAKKSALPLIAPEVCYANLRKKFRCTTKVSTQSDQHQDIRLD